jgi:signal transduction histidine kinase
VTTLEVSDNGKGFDPAVLKTQRRATGLCALRDRVALAGGSMKIDSRQRQGTRIVVDLQGEAAAA